MKIQKLHKGHCGGETSNLTWFHCGGKTQNVTEVHYGGENPNETWVTLVEIIQKLYGGHCGGEIQKWHRNCGGGSPRVKWVHMVKYNPKGHFGVDNLKVTWDHSGG